MYAEHTRSPSRFEPQLKGHPTSLGRRVKPGDLIVHLYGACPGMYDGIVLSIEKEYVIVWSTATIAADKLEDPEWASHVELPESWVTILYPDEVLSIKEE